LEASRLEQERQEFEEARRATDEGSEIAEVEALNRALFGDAPRNHAPNPDEEQLRLQRVRYRLQQEKAELEEKEQLRLALERSEEEAQQEAVLASLTPPSRGPRMYNPVARPHRNYRAVASQYEAADADVANSSWDMDVEVNNEDLTDDHELHQALEASRLEEERKASAEKQKTEKQRRRVKELEQKLAEEAQILRQLEEQNASRMPQHDPDDEDFAPDDYERAIEESLALAEREERSRVRQDQDQRFEESLQRDRVRWLTLNLI